MSTSLNALVLIVLLNSVCSVPVKRQTNCIPACSRNNLCNNGQVHRVQTQAKNNLINIIGETVNGEIKQLYDLTAQNLSQLLTNSNVTEQDVRSALVARNVCDLYAAHQSASKLNIGDLAYGVEKRCDVVQAFFSKFTDNFECNSSNTFLQDNNSTDVLRSLCLHRIGNPNNILESLKMLMEDSHSHLPELDCNCLCVDQ